MIITAYCGGNFKSCLDITINSWSFCNNKIYTDSGEFGIQLFESSTTDFKESCRRRIVCLKKVLEENLGKNVLLLDVDVMIISNPEEVFENNFDIALTRMINRKNSIYEDANIGVVFCRSNERTIKMCDLWIETTEEYSKNLELSNPDQTALTDIAIKGYDGLIDLKVTNVSENIYNFERNDVKSWISGIKKYHPKIIHLKNKKWENKYCVNWLSEYAKNN
jgi:hypothetical protein